MLDIGNDLILCTTDSSRSGVRYSTDSTGRNDSCSRFAIEQRESLISPVFGFLPVRLEDQSAFLRNGFIDIGEGLQDALSGIIVRLTKRCRRVGTSGRDGSVDLQVEA